MESANGALKRRLKQHLLLRGTRGFESVEEYEARMQEARARAEPRKREGKKERKAMQAGSELSGRLGGAADG